MEDGEQRHHLLEGRLGSGDAVELDDLKSMQCLSALVYAGDAEAVERCGLNCGTRRRDRGSAGGART